MEKYLAALLLALPITAHSAALANFSAICTDPKDFAETMEKFGEVPLGRGESVRNFDTERISLLVIFVNPVTRTWTMAEKISSDVVCVVATGNEFEPLTEEGLPIETPKQFRGT